MISRNDALEFLQTLKGEYLNQVENFYLNIYSLGYGIIFELRENDKPIFHGLTSLKNNHLECYLLVGLPNIIHANGEMKNKTTLILTTFSPAIEINLCLLDSHQLQLSVVIENKSCLLINLVKQNKS